MPKVGLQPIRRRQLIDATIATIHADGYDETTLARIARRAGMSAGLIAHYFGGKDELLVATMRSLLHDLQAQVVELLRAAPTAWARLEAIVRANFDESQCRPEVVTAWLAFWARVPHAPELQRLQEVYRRRLRSNLRHALRELGVPEGEIEEAAETLGSLIDGIWVRAALGGRGLDFVSARRRVLRTLGLIVTRFDGRPPAEPAAPRR